MAGAFVATFFVATFFAATFLVADGAAAFVVAAFFVVDFFVAAAVPVLGGAAEAPLTRLAVDLAAEVARWATARTLLATMGTSFIVMARHLHGPGTCAEDTTSPHGPQ